MNDKEKRRARRRGKGKCGMLLVARKAPTFKDFTARSSIAGWSTYKMTLAHWATTYPNIQQPTTLHAMVWRSGPIGPEWELVKPILLKIERDEDGEYLVTDTFSTVYGNGKTSTKAQNDYCESLVEYYDLLRRRAGDEVQTALAFRALAQHLRRIPRAAR